MKVLNYNDDTMTKKEAIYLFGTRLQDLAVKLSRGKSAISQWPQQLTKDQCAMVIGYAVINGVILPADLLRKCRIKFSHTK